MNVRVNEEGIPIKDKNKQTNVYFLSVRNLLHGEAVQLDIAYLEVVCPSLTLHIHLA